MAALSWFLEDEGATVRAGQRLGRLLRGGGVIWLHGDLGAGKTTLSRGILRGCGHEGRVKSPTYTLVEPYELPQLNIFHFDLYRLNDPEELEYMGFRDYLDPAALLLIEWPERGDEGMPAPDLGLTLTVVGAGRRLCLEAYSEDGEALLAALQVEQGGG